MQRLERSLGGVVLQYVWVVQDYDYHIDFTGSTTGTGLVIWDRAADDLEGEEAVRGGQRDDMTTGRRSVLWHNVVEATSIE
jgi:hypothetical protein